MLELILCSLFTLLPDYLYRRYVQGKRLGKEITFFSVWYELRWGITGCLMLTISLITMIFYFHPSTTSAALYFRTVPILPEGSGRVAEVNVGFSEAVKKGDVLFRLDSSKQQAAMAKTKIDSDKTSVLAGVDSSVERFLVRTGDVVNQLMRPAGMLLPESTARSVMQASFGQIQAQFMKPWMISEAACIS